MIRRALVLGPLSGAALLLLHCVGEDPGAGETTQGEAGIDAARPSDSDGGVDGNSTQDASTDAEAGPSCTSTPCVVQIAAGGAHTCARMIDGSVRCWGANAFGECGGGTIIPPPDGGDESVNPPTYSTPNIVTGIPAPATVIGAGGSYRAYGVSCVGTTDLKMYCWGIDKSQQLGRGGEPLGFDLTPAPARPVPAAVFALQNVRDVSVGVRHACAVFTAGAVACWGGDLRGALGFAPAGKTYGKPQTLAVAVKFERVVSHGQHNLALTDTGKVWGWGDNNDSQHAIAPTNYELPSEITALGGKYVDIAAGRFHGCALDTTGKVWCWGKGTDGQLGRGPSSLVTVDATPKVVSFPAGSIVKQISGDEQHVVALLDNGTVYEWGRTIIGVPPDAIGTVVDTPTQVSLPKPAIQITGGYEHACALLDGGSVHCWGNNRSGELGRGSAAGAGTVSSPASVVW